MQEKVSTKRGQILVAMVVLILLSLALGISIAGGFITNIKIQTQADELSKAQSAAEALVEKMLLIPSDTLEEYIENNSCGSNCTWQVTDATGQPITATATLSYAGESSDEYDVDLETTSVVQVNLTGYPSGKILDICWDSPASVYASYLKESSGVISAKVYAYNSTSTSYPDNGLPTAAANHGHTNCFTVTASDTPELIRLKSYYLNTPVSVFPESGTPLPKQGVVITSLGRSGTATREVSVLKSTGALPDLFDYVIYQRSADDPLSNVIL